MSSRGDEVWPRAKACSGRQEEGWPPRTQGRFHLQRGDRTFAPVTLFTVLSGLTPHEPGRGSPSRFPSPFSQEDSILPSGVDGQPFSPSSGLGHSGFVGSCTYGTSVLL